MVERTDILMDEKVKYWIELAEYDLDVAKSMLKTEKYLYVGFMCHQTIEKALKGYFQQKLNDTPPYTHNLIKLAGDASLIEEMSEEDFIWLSELNPLNIEARYPTYRDFINQKLNKEICDNLCLKTEEV